MNAPIILPPGFAECSREEFFNTVGKMDVHPAPQGKWDRANGGYICHWKTRSGAVVGIDRGGKYYKYRSLSVCA